MGSVILQAGDLRVLTKHSTVMCHAGSDGFSGHPTSFIRWADNTKEVNKQCCKIYREQMIKKNPKITLGQIDKMFDHDAIFTSEQAVKIGLADQIMEEVTKEV